MFDIGWGELLLIGVVALVAIGPKELPNAIYQLGKWTRKARMAAREFQTHIDDMMREAELDELRKAAMQARDMDLVRKMEETVDPAGEIKSAMALPASPPLQDADDRYPETPPPSAPQTGETYAEPSIGAPNTIAPNIVPPPTPPEEVPAGSSPVSSKT